jgi:hypothetical protein
MRSASHQFLDDRKVYDDSLRFASSVKKALLRCRQICVNLRPCHCHCDTLFGVVSLL